MSHALRCDTYSCRHCAGRIVAAKLERFAREATRLPEVFYATVSSSDFNSDRLSDRLRNRWASGGGYMWVRRADDSVVAIFATLELSGRQEPSRMIS